MKKKLIISASIAGISSMLYSANALAQYEGVEHEVTQDSVTFSWEDDAEYFEVFKDGEKIWRGSDHIYKADDLDPDVQYNFIIASYNNDELIEFEEVKVSTEKEALARNFKSNDNSFEEITVEHKVKSQEGLVITWDNEIPNSEDTYNVTKNGESIGEITENQLFDEEIDPGEEYLYEIEGVIEVSEDEKAKRLQELEDISVEITPEIEESVSYDSYFLNRYVKVPETDLQQRLASQKNSVNRFGIQYTTFIPNDYVAILWGVGGYVSGDNRMTSSGNAQFDPFSNKYRTRTAIRADFTNNRVEGDNSVEWINSQGLGINSTVRYNSSKDIIDEKFAEPDKFSRTNTSINSSRASWNLEHSIGIPFLYEAPPNIDYNYAVNITANGSGRISGIHDLAPAHEIAVYIPESSMHFMIYTRDNEGFHNLFPTHGNQNFNASF